MTVSAPHCSAQRSFSSSSSVPLLTGEAPDYGDFLEMRRKLMAQKIKTYFEGL